MTAKQIVEQLCQFPNRAIGSKQEEAVLSFISQQFDQKWVKKESFYSPKTYISIVWYLVLGIALGLICLNFSTFIGLILVFLFVTMAMLYFNWYASPITKFPPRIKTHNLVINPPQNSNISKKLILMAHWDTAPISILYRPELVGNFRKSLKSNLIFMLFAQFLAISIFFVSNGFLLLLANILAFYFILQGFVSSIDYFRMGHSNGASDNATGVAAALVTAQQLWSKELKNLQIELVITGAEEVGMLGAREYLQKHYQEFTSETFLINFDTLGHGDLKIITRTGSWSDIVYENTLTTTAKNICANETTFKNISIGAWHTGDFDSVWFQRAGIPSLTLAALDKQGKMPYIHRPTDTFEKLDFKPMQQSIDLAVKIGMALNQS